MDYESFLEKIINDGIAAAKEDYDDPRDKLRLEGSIEGFEACRGKTPEEIRKVFEKATLDTFHAMESVHNGEISHDEYWKIRCREAEVEWVANCVSAILVNSGKPALFVHLPTARAVLKTAEVVGVKK